MAVSPQVSAHPRICWRRTGKASKVGRARRGREAPINASEWTLSSLEETEQALQQGKILSMSGYVYTVFKWKENIIAQKSCFN